MSYFGETVSMGCNDSDRTGRRIKVVQRSVLFDS